MPFSLVRNDIVNMRVDAIVNAANSSLAPQTPPPGAIFAAAGRTALEKACRAIGHCDVGSAVITPGFDLPARYVIHAVGPIWQGGSRGEADLLHSCYTRALHLARENGCESIAFPLISSGIFGYPKPQALRVAINAIEEFLLKYEMQVYLVIFDRAALLISERLYENIQRYIDDRYVELRAFPRQAAEALPHARQRAEQADLPLAAPCATPGKRSLDDLLGHLDESFSRMLLRLIDEKGMTDVEVYKRANLDRKLFSKIRKEGYNPSKQTALALAIALRLNLDETKDLLGRAGYALSHSNKFDIIIEYFIEEGVYDIFEINEALFAFEQRLLGA